MNSFDQNWRRLTAAARLAPEVRDTAAPLGFATRVAALALSGEPRPSFAFLLSRLSWRALGFACVLAAVSFVASYPAITNTAEEEPGAGDAVAEVLALS